VAFVLSNTFFDTADVYGANANEVLVGKVQLVYCMYLFLLFVDEYFTVLTNQTLLFRT